MEGDLDLKMLRGVIMTVALIVALLLYLSAFRINDSNMIEKLSHYVDAESFKILDVIELEDDQNILVPFETENHLGVFLLHKGLNGHYQITDVHQTQAIIDGVSFLVKGRDYSIIYGRDRKQIDQIRFFSDGQESIEEIDDESFFILKDGRTYEGRVEIVYEYSYANDAKHIELHADQGSSWSNVMVPLRSVLILLLSTLVTTILKRRYSRTSDYSKMPIDGQRIRQDWFR